MIATGTELKRERLRERIARLTLQLNDAENDYYAAGCAEMFAVGEKCRKLSVEISEAKAELEALR